jgi:hypothetical protein
MLFCLPNSYLVPVFDQWQLCGCFNWLGFVDLVCGQTRAVECHSNVEMQDTIKAICEHRFENQPLLARHVNLIPFHVSALVDYPLVLPVSQSATLQELFGITRSQDLTGNKGLKKHLKQRWEDRGMFQSARSALTGEEKAMLKRLARFAKPLAIACEDHKPLQFWCLVMRALCDQGSVTGLEDAAKSIQRLASKDHAYSLWDTVAGGGKMLFNGNKPCLDGILSSLLQFCVFRIYFMARWQSMLDVTITRGTSADFNAIVASKMIPELELWTRPALKSANGRILDLYIASWCSTRLSERDALMRAIATAKMIPEEELWNHPAFEFATGRILGLYVVWHFKHGVKATAAQMCFATCGSGNIRSGSGTAP